MQMNSASLRKACDKNGVFWAREQLRALPEGHDRQAVAEWIAAFDAREKAVRDAVRAKLVESSKSGGMASVERPAAPGTLSRWNILEGIFDLGQFVEAVGAILRW